MQESLGMRLGEVGKQFHSHQGVIPPISAGI